MKTLRAILSLALAAFTSQAAVAQSEGTGIASVIGAPFSAVRSQQSAKNFADGNRIDNGSSSRLYRDGQGRTRTELDTPAQMLAANPQMEPTQITISDPQSGETVHLLSKLKVAMVTRGPAASAISKPVQAPHAFITFARHLYGANDPGWSKPVSLGEKSFDGVQATGTRTQYTIPVGVINNEKPILLTVDQWYSTQLSLLIEKRARSSLGGELGFETENIVAREPDPALFSIPADYKRIEMGKQRTAQ